MSHASISSLALCSTLLLGLSAPAQAASEQPGSLLVFPLFDNTRGEHTLLTVTNTNADTLQGTIKVEFVYINKQNCLEFNRTRTLTPNDTISVLTKIDNPNMTQGYVYAYAKSLTTGKAVKFDHLVGQALALGSRTFELNALTFRAAAALAENAPTDLENGGIGDGLRDLDGLEYEPAPAELLVPRFFGQGGAIESELVLINLTGGAHFDALLDFLIYNDNEEVFSAQYSFRCWQRVGLSQISNAFDNAFLATTNHASNEIQQGSSGPNLPETGWFRFNGNLANSIHTVLLDPAILAIRIESNSAATWTALPYSTGTQANGSLLSHSITGQ